MNLPNKTLSHLRCMECGNTHDLNEPVYVCGKCGGLLDVVHDLPDDDAEVMMCGHNPGLEDLALMLIPDIRGDELRDELEAKFPTASIAELQFDVEKWADIKEGGGRITRFIRPRDLDADLGPEQD